MILPQNTETWPEDWKFLYEERAGILEYLANLPRKAAEKLAAEEIRKQALRER